MNSVSEEEVEFRLSSSFGRQADSIEVSTVPSLVEPSMFPRSLALIASLILVALVSTGLLVAQQSGWLVGEESVREAPEFASSGDELSQENAGTSDFVWGDDGSGPANMNCVVDSSPSELVQRDFVLFGTIESVTTEATADPGDSGVEQRVVANVAVEQWLRGGDEDVVSVVFQRPVKAGDRLLVAGSTSAGYLAWECGFTINRSTEAEKAWTTAFR